MACDWTLHFQPIHCISVNTAEGSCKTSMTIPVRRLQDVLLGQFLRNASNDMLSFYSVFKVMYTHSPNTPRTNVLAPSFKKKLFVFTS